MECTCDPSFLVPPPCSQKEKLSCVGFDISWIVIFGVTFVIMCYEFYTQIIRQYAKRLNLKLASYLSSMIAILVRLARFGMIVFKVGSVALLDVLFFLPDLLIFASYSVVFSVWIVSFLIAHGKSAYWIWGVRLGLAFANIIYWVALYTTLGVNFDHFTSSLEPTTIIGVALFTAGVSFLVFGRTMAMVAKTDTDIIGKESTAHKISQHTYWACAAIFFLGIVVVLISVFITVEDNFTYFIVRHSVYGIVDICFVGGLLLILHQKPLRKSVGTEKYVNQI